MGNRQLKIGLAAGYWTGLLTCASSGPRGGSGFDLYNVRHSETVANVTKEYNNETQGQFSSKGQAEIRALAKALGAEKIDHVLVSHFNAGQKLIGSLTDQGDAPTMILETGKITHLRQEPNGRFRIVKLNGEPTSVASQ